jgi:hypothetical protein
MTIKVFLFSFLIFLASVLPVQAHVLKSDGSVGAVLHVNPEDDPIVGESSNFFFEFKDKKGKFKPEDCDCQGKILRNGQEIYTTFLFQNNANPSLDNASFAFIFPEKDIYQVRVSGSPRTSESFEPFILTWDVRVARQSEKSTDTTSLTTQTTKNGLIDWFSRHIPHLVGITLIFLFAASYLAKEKRSRQT